MFGIDDSIENIQQLFIEFKKYLALQKRYTRLEIAEKLTILFSTLLLILIAGGIGIVALFYISFMLAYALEPLVGGLTISFAIISGFHLVLLLLVVAFRKRLIINPMAKFIAGLFIPNENA